LKFLVTGANGFLGSEIVRQLRRRDDEVVALVRRNFDFLDSLGCQSYIGDIRDYDAILGAFDGIDAVIHTAAVSGIWGDWKKYYSVNTVGTRNVVNACRDHHVSKLVYTSSPSVTFDGQHQVHVNETAPYPTKWLANYPKSKALAEQYVLEANEPPELMTCALRPHLIWGPGDPHLIPRLIARARENKLRRVGDGRNLVDNVYVENAAMAHLLAADKLSPDSPVCGKAYFISQDDPVNCWQWINDILKLAGLQPVKKSISFFWAWRLGYLAELFYEGVSAEKEPQMTRFLAAQLAKSHYFDISQAKHDLGYNPQVSIEEGMQRLAAHLKP
jgi:2-alkyl-3-oxoalkanoate reductase